MTRLASGPQFALRDACLSISDLDIETIQSLPVQPIEPSTILGDKFPDIVKQCKDNLHISHYRWLLLALINRHLHLKKIPSKPAERVTRPTSNLSVTAGPSAARSSTFSQNRTFNRGQKRNSRNKVSFKPAKKEKGPKSSFP